MRILIFIAFVSLLISCKKNDPTSEFTSYLGSIENLTVPVSLRDVKPSANYDTALFRKFKHNDAQKPCAKLTITDTVVLLIEQMSFSEENMIRTVSTSGRELDMKTLFAKTEDCSSDYGFSCNRDILINGDRTILVTDSIRQSKINNKGELIEDSEQLRVSQRKWEIDGSGHFVSGKVVNVDSAIVAQMTLGMNASLRTVVSENYPEITDTTAFHYNIYFVDLDPDKPNVIVSFTYDSDGTTHKPDDVVIVYFKQKHDQWSIGEVEIVPLSSLDNGDN